MFRKKMFILYMSVFGLLACSESPKNEGSILVDLTPKMPEVTITKVIPLETREDALLDDFYHLHSTPSYYVVQDKGKIIIYDKSGKIHRVITPIGRGPNEVLQLVHIFPDDKSIKILDVTSRKIIEYGYDGDYLKSIEIESAPTEFSILNENYLFDFQNGKLHNGHVFALCDARGGTIKTGIGIIAENLIYGTEKFQLRDGYAFYLPSHHNTVYRIDSIGTIDSYYSFDFGRHWPDADIAERYKNSVNVFDFWRHLQENDRIGFLKFKETDDVILLNFERVDAIYNWFYNKNNHDQYLVKMNDTPRSIAGSKVLNVEGNSFIFGIPAFDCQNYPILSELEIEEMDNPVLLIGHLNGSI